jgi:hypothetical protein
MPFFVNCSVCGREYDEYEFEECPDCAEDEDFYKNSLLALLNIIDECYEGYMGENDKLNTWMQRLGNEADNFRFLIADHT